MNSFLIAPLRQGIAIALILLAVSCSKDKDETEPKGSFSASWVENDSSQTYTAKSFDYNPSFRMITLFSVPGVGSSRNLSLLLADTLVGKYPVWTGGSGYSSAMLNAFNPTTGSMMFNSDSGQIEITKKQPGWISGIFRIYGHANSGNLKSLKGEFNYVDLK